MCLGLVQQHVLGNDGPLLEARAPGARLTTYPELSLHSVCIDI